MAKMMFFKYYIELCKKITRRYKERKISDNSNTLEVNITRECIKEFLENPPELVKRCDKHILLGLLYLTAFPSKKKVIASAICFVTGFYLGGMAVFIVGYDSLASIIFGLLAMLFLSISFGLVWIKQSRWGLYIIFVTTNFYNFKEIRSQKGKMNQIEKKAAEWDGVVDAVQDSSSRRERLEKRLIYLQDYLQKYDDVSEQIYNSFSKEIAEIEEELGKLGG